MAENLADKMVARTAGTRAAKKVDRTATTWVVYLVEKRVASRALRTAGLMAGRLVAHLAETTAGTTGH